MAAGSVFADVIGFIGGVSIARWANVVFVLLLPHQLGQRLRRRLDARWPRRAFWGMVVVGFAG